MNGKPEKWCGRCGGSGVLSGGVVCPCTRRSTPILKPIKCKACGTMYSPPADGGPVHHGSLGWSCDGKTKRKTS